MSDQPEGPGNVQPGGEKEPIAEVSEAEKASADADAPTDDGPEDWPPRSGSKLAEEFDQKRYSIFPGLDYAAYFPKIEPPDLSSILRPLTAHLEREAEAIAPLMKRLLESLPPNWPTDIDPDKLTTVMQEDGLPLVWVPRAEIVTELLAAPDPPARIALLLARADEGVEDCRHALSEVISANFM